MIRTLQFSSFAQKLIPWRLVGPDQAYTHDRLGATPGQAPASRRNWGGVAGLSMLIANSNQHTLIMAETFRLLAVATLRPRQGPRAWEIGHLYLSTRGLDQVEELLEQCVTYVGHRGGERLFLRVQEQNPLINCARHVGFIIGPTERVYLPSQPLNTEEGGSMLRLRPLEAEDLHGLFRLHSACAPTAVRTAYGPTFDQWYDAWEEPAGSSSEHIWERNTAVRGWLRLFRGRSGTVIDAMLHPEEEPAALLLYDGTLRLTDGDQQPAWIVPDHQHALARALEWAGWTPCYSYVTLIKSLVKPVEQASMAVARV